MAKCGISSRRKAESIIAEGRVRVNGRTVREMGIKIDPDADVVEVSGKRLAAVPQLVYVALHKPKGVVSTAKENRGRRQVVELVKTGERLFPVGRLDMDSEGLIVLTNDGSLANRLTHPRYHVPKKYRVWHKGSLAPAEVKTLREGIVLEDGKTAPAKVHVRRAGKEGSLCEVVLYEGKKRQIRRMFQAIGHPVTRLLRIEIGGLRLGSLKPGDWRRFSPSELGPEFGERKKKRI